MPNLQDSSAGTETTDDDARDPSHHQQDREVKAGSIGLGQTTPALTAKRLIFVVIVGRRRAVVGPWRGTGTHGIGRRRIWLRPRDPTVGPGRRRPRAGFE